MCGSITLQITWTFLSLNFPNVISLGILIVFHAQLPSVFEFVVYWKTCHWPSEISFNGGPKELEDDFCYWCLRSLKIVPCLYRNILITLLLTHLMCIGLIGAIILQVNFFYSVVWYFSIFKSHHIFVCAQTLIPFLCKVPPNGFHLFPYSFT